MANENYLNRIYSTLPCYAGDVSGVCSALYELGGMVVVHDPSGCNSTYNTHDETRWYDRDSMIYITGLTESDAVFGNDGKYIREICEAAGSLCPKFVCLTSSPIPYIACTDLGAMANEIEKRTGIPAFYVRANGMHDYVRGAGEAFAEFAKKFVADKENGSKVSDETSGETNYETSAGNDSKTYSKEKTLNILGLTPLDFGAADSEKTLRKNTEEAGWRIVSCWAMGDDFETLKGAAHADINLVISATGYAAAKLMYEKYGIPYVAGTPVGGYNDSLLEAMEKARAEKKNIIYCAGREEKTDNPVYLIGEPVSMGSYARLIEKDKGVGTKLLCPVEADGALLAGCDEIIKGEICIREALKNAAEVIADPMYRAVCPPDAKFISLPHQAFSGRLGWKEMKNL